MSVAHTNARTNRTDELHGFPTTRHDHAAGNAAALRLVAPPQGEGPPAWLLALPERTRCYFTDAECRQPEPPAWWAEMPHETRELVNHIGFERAEREARRRANPDGFARAVAEPLPIRVCAAEYDLWLATDVYLDGERCEGLCNASWRYLVVSVRVPAARRLSVFFHELAHAVLFELPDTFPPRLNHEQVAETFALAMGCMDAPTLARVEHFLLDAKNEPKAPPQ